MNHHRHALTPILALALISALAAGCSPAAEPTPTPTPAFASEEEAFAAAEETYRAYIDASNADRRGQVSESLDFLTGEALDAELASRRELEAAGVRLEGASRVLSVNEVTGDFKTPVANLVAQFCLDISMARAVNAAGQDITVEGRSDVYAVDVSLTGTSDLLLIASLEIVTDVPC